MNVHGELKRAQLEQSVGNPADAITSRIYSDITDPSAALPKFYDGSNWKTLQFVDSGTAIYSQNSGKAVTVNWANGTTQEVVLTDNAVISFSNPVEEEVYTLIIKQNQTVTLGDGNLYNYTLNMTDLETSSKPYQPEYTIPLGKERVYKFLRRSGVSAAVSNVPAQSWTLLNYTATAHYGSAFSRDGKAWAAARFTTPYVDVALVFENCSPTQQIPLGYINLVAPTAAVGVVTDVLFHPTKNIMVQSNQTSPYIQTFFLNHYSPSPASITSPGTAPTGAANCAVVHPTGNYVGVGHATSPFMSLYPFDGTAYGTKLTNPGTLPSAQVTSLEFSPQGDYLAAATQTTPFIHVYAFSDAAGTGTIGAISANPGALPTGGPASVGVGARGIAWRPQGDWIAMAMTTSPYLYVVPFDRSTGTFGNSISVAGAGLVAQANSVAWTPDGQYLIVGCNASGGSSTLYVIDFSSQTIGASVTFDGGILSGVQINCVSVCPNGEYMIITYNASPWSALLSLPKKARNYLLLDN